MNIYLTRHGETKWNIERRMQGKLDSPLTDKGIENAHRLGKRLENEKIDTIYSSVAGRAVKTSEILAKYLNSPEIIATEELNEICVGVWQGMLYKDIIKNYGDEFELYTTKPLLYEPVPGGENYIDFEFRLKKFVDDMTKKGGDVIIVTHGVAYIMLLNIFEGKNLEDLFEREIPIGTSLSKIIYDKKFKIIFENEISHLI